MIKILDKLFYYIKNLVLPFLMFATIYIVMMMFQRLGKEPFGANFLEFIEVILPYILLIVLLLINTFLKQDEVRNNFFYNVTSFLAILTIFVFCYRAIFDKNLILWHKLKYDIDFNYFTDQIAPMKTILYMLSAANIMLMIKGYLKEDKELETETKAVKEEKEELPKDNFIIENEEDTFENNSYNDFNYLEPKEEIKENNNNNNNNKHNNKNYYYNNKNKKNNYYKKNNNNNYYKKNNNQNKQNQNNNTNNNKTKKTLDFYE